MRCRATSSRTGKPCRNHPVNGATVCMAHGGAAPQVRRKAAERVARQRAGAHLAAEGINLSERDPLTELGRQLALSAEVAERVRELVSDLDTIHGDDNETHALVSLWCSERDRVARFAKMSIELGVPERAIQLAHGQARLMVQVVEDAFTDASFALTEAQKAAGRKAIARHLRALDDSIPDPIEDTRRSNGHA